MKILLTGASGCVGTQVAQSLAKRGHSVLALIHKKKDLVTYDKKTLNIVEKSVSKARPKEIVKVKGDISKPYLGTSEEIFIELEKSVDTIVHCAARIEFGRDMNYYSPVNIEGTKNVVDLARNRVKKIPLIYVGTVYISGEMNGEFSEFDFNVGQIFGNAYEESKYIAEKYVRDAYKNNPNYVIVRPSIVVGDSKNGATSAYNTIYPILRVLTAGKVRSIPAEYNALYNIIPVDYVCDALVQLVEKYDEVKGKTFHVVNHDSISNRDLSNILAEYPSFYVPRYISPHSFDINKLDDEERRYYDIIVKSYVTYFKRRVIFTRSETEKNIQFKRNVKGTYILRKALNYCLKTGYLGRPFNVNESNTK